MPLLVDLFSSCTCLKFQPNLTSFSLVIAIYLGVDFYPDTMYMIIFDPQRENKAVLSLKEASDSKLEKEQAGFRQHRFRSN